jgi:hypothetical protein
MTKENDKGQRGLKGKLESSFGSLRGCGPNTPTERHIENSIYGLLVKLALVSIIKPGRSELPDKFL